MTVQAIPGYIQGRSHTYAYGDPLPAQMVNLLQDDLALLSNALVQTVGKLYNPAIFTSDWKMPCIAAADQVTLEDNVPFLVGGVLFNTRDMASRIFQAPDNATRFLRIGVDPSCGLLQAYETQPGVVADPLVRNQVAVASFVPGDETDPAGTGGGPSTNASMRVLKAVKGGPGSTPAITLYINQPDSQSQGTSSSSGGVILPAGLVIPWPSDVVPPFGLLCNGAFYSRTIYANLYGYLGLAEGDILPANGVTAISVDSGGDRITLDRALPVGYVVRLSSTGTLPGGLQPGQDYWVREPSGNSFKVSTTASGLLIDLTDNGSGTLTVLSQSFRVPILEGYFLRGKDNGRGVDLGAAGRLARGDGLTGDRVLTVQMDAMKRHVHPLGQGGGVSGASAKLDYQVWNDPSQPYNVYTMDMTCPGDTLQPSRFANVPQADETTVRNKSVNYIITHGLTW